MSVLKQKAKKLPRMPGVYLFKNSKNRVIYVGKAKVLRNRVGSYFQTKIADGTKTKALVKNIADLDYIEALSELEALILEAALIKKYKPKYNVALKDDKSYLYIIIRMDIVVLDGAHCQVPKLITARETGLKPKDVKFGPYPSSYIAKIIFRSVRKAFPYADCSSSKFNKYQKLNSPCLYGHVGLCSAPCTQKTNLKEYKADVTRIKKLLSGESVRLVRDLERQMLAAAKKQDYEMAAKFRNMLKKLEYVRRSARTADKYIDNPYLVEDLMNQSLDELVLNIPVLKKIPQRIECYDISNLSGKEATASMVVAIKGRLKNNEYRRFKVNFKDTPDDFEMMREVLRRRLKRENFSLPKRWGRPDLIVVDGGKGQVSAALEVLHELNLSIPVIGIAKRHETLIFQTNNDFKEICLAKTNEGLKLVQRLRDEAHRFARKYHHYLRLKKIKG